MWRVSRLAEEIITVSQEGICSMKLVSYLEEKCQENHETCLC
jgi:hypothetical protein